MSCAFFRPVTDSRRRVSAGVLGYCVGYSEEKLRVPSLGEYQKYCSTDCQAGCPVFDFRTKEEVGTVIVGKSSPDTKSQKTVE